MLQQINLKYINLTSNLIYQIFTAFKQIITQMCPKSVTPGKWHANKTTTLEQTGIHDQQSDE